MNRTIVILDKHNTAIVTLTNPANNQIESMECVDSLTAISLCIMMFAAEQQIPAAFVECAITYPDGRQTIRLSHAA